MLGLAGAAFMGANKAKADIAKAALRDTAKTKMPLAMTAREKGMNMARKVAKKAIMPKSKPAMGMGMDLSNVFGLEDMSGAKYGKMIKAKNGVMARGCKLGKNKKTIMT